MSKVVRTFTFSDEDLKEYNDLELASKIAISAAKEFAKTDIDFAKFMEDVRMHTNRITMCMNKQKDLFKKYVSDYDHLTEESDELAVHINTHTKVALLIFTKEEENKNGN